MIDGRRNWGLGIGEMGKGVRGGKGGQMTMIDGRRGLAAFLNSLHLMPTGIRVVSLALC